jgi:hypothetical protein
MWGRSKGWLNHPKWSSDGSKFNGSWVGHLGIDEELISYGKYLMEHVTTKFSKC